MTGRQEPDDRADDDQVAGTLTDPAMIRALSHPARLTIVEHLSGVDSATATELAGVVGLSPSATSYHLRAMARHGLVEEAAGRGDGRERRWRWVGGFHLEADLTGTTERRKAEMALIAAVLARANERVLSWVERIGDEPAEWAHAAGINDTRIVVTAAELAEITDAYRDLLQPYLRHNRPDPPAGARTVSAHLRLTPVA